METEPSLGDGEAVDTQLPVQDASMQALCSLIRFVLLPLHILEPTHSTLFYCAPPCAPPWLRSGCCFSIPFTATTRRMLL